MKNIFHLGHIALILALSFASSLFAQTFTKVTSGNIVTDAANSVGMAWGDYDGDGKLDLFVANWGGLNNSLYHNSGDGTFTKITTGSVVNDGGNSASCAWGDYDNDGHLDLFVANAYESNFLYHNNGNGTFAKVTSGAIVTDVGGWYGCAWGDYDNDSYIDLYVANITGPNVLYRNNRDGTFSKVTTGNIVTENQASISCAWGDYDNDGWLDLFVARGLNQDNALYHNSGDGTFTTVITAGIVISGSSSVGCAWGDYDNDGYLDLYVPNRLQPGFLFHNNGNGTFTRITSGSIVTDVNDGDGCSWGDYNNDGYLDLFVANWRGQNDALYQNNGDGTFTRITTGAPVTAGGDGAGCGWGDFNNDGQLDLFVANVAAPTTSESQNNFLYRNDGNNNSWITIKCIGTASNRSGIGARVKVDATIQGTLRSQVRQISSANGWDGQGLSAHFGLGDATVIGTLRVEWPSGVVQTLTNVAIARTLTVNEPNASAPVITAPFTKLTSGNVATDVGNSVSCAWGDYDGDGNLDLFVGNYAGVNNFLYHNNGDGTFTKITNGSIVNDGGNTAGCAWGDYDNDGFPDLFVANVNENNFLYHNNRDGTFAKITTGSIVTDGGASYGCAWGDYDNDGYLDLFVANAFSPSFLYHNNRDGTFTRVTTGILATDIQASDGCVWGDYDNDGWLDLFVANGNNENNALYHNNGDGTFTKISTGAIVSDAGYSVGCAWGDYDNDGFLDLYVANRLGVNFLYHNNGNGTFTKITAGSIVTDVADSNGCSWGDYNNDGYLDLFVANWNGQSDALYQNNGDGTFTKITTGDLVTDGGNGVGSAWGDFNNDGQLDLFVANWLGQNNFLYRNDGNHNSWITINCVGTRSNRGGIGARVKVDATIQGSARSQVRQIGSGNDGWDGPALNAHFGLGNATVITSVRVEWPSGTSQTLNNVAVNQTLTLTESAALSSIAVVTTLAGSGAPGFANGQGVAAQFYFPNGAFVDAAGFVYIADDYNHRLRRVSPNGAVTTLAGTGAAGYRDGPGDAAQFNYPLGVFVARAGDVFVTDTENNRIRKISRVGFRTVSTVAGDGQRGYLDGPSATAKFNFPNDLVVDAAGNIFVSEFNNHTIRKIAPDGAVSTLVGNGAAGYVDGRGTSARLNQPGGLAIDKNGNLFVTDWGNQRIRKITPDGSVTTLAGSGLAGFVDGPASTAQFKEPDGITVDPDGNLFITEHGNHAVRKIAPDGTVSTVAGKGAAGFADGTAAVALFNAPGGIGIDSAGNLLVADAGNHRVRKITFGTPPQIVVQPLSQSVALGAAVSFVVEATGTPPLSYQWRINGTNWTGQTQPTLVIPQVSDADAGSWTVVVSNPLGSVTSVAAELSVVTKPPVASSATRQLPSQYFPGSRFTVTIAANPPVGTTVYAVEDRPPIGWTVANPSAGGRFDALNQTVKFGPFFDVDARVLTYEVTSTPNETGPKRFSGTISVDGSSVPLGGADLVNSESLHPADNRPADHRIAIDEVTAYSAAWRKGQSWVNPPNPIPIDYVTRAGALWKNGEAYHVDPRVSAPPLWWVNDTNGPTVGRQRLTQRSFLTPISLVTADTPDHFIITEPFTVTLHVTPSAGVSVYAAEDQIGYPGYPAGSPTGLQVTNISHNGEYDSNGGQIRWGPFFDDQPRDLSYQVGMPYTPPRLLGFTGSVSFDGTGVPVAGRREVAAGSRLNLVSRQPDEPIQLQLLGSGSFRIEASTNLTDWTTVMDAVVLKDLRFIDLNAGEFPQRYYRAREIR